MAWTEFYTRFLHLQIDHQNILPLPHTHISEGLYEYALPDIVVFTPTEGKYIHRLNEDDALAQKSFSLNSHQNNLISYMIFKEMHFYNTHTHINVTAVHRVVTLGSISRFKI